MFDEITKEDIEFVFNSGMLDKKSNETISKRFGEILKAKWSNKFINDLPDSSFLYIKPGGEKDEDNKTKPRSLRYFPIKDPNGSIDLPHLRNALARITQSALPKEVKESLIKAAKKMLEDTKEVNKSKSLWAGII